MTREDWQTIECKGLYDMVVVGCSAGGIESLTQILKALPKDFSLTVVIVQHISHDSKRSLAVHFADFCQIPVYEVEDKEPIKRGAVYFAPTNYHLLVGQDIFHLSIDPPVFFSRPSIDVLFETAADIYKQRLIGMILTGTNQDGSEGLKAVREKGGLAIAQDPLTAKYAIMPQMALDLANPQLVLTLEQIGLFFKQTIKAISIYSEA